MACGVFLLAVLAQRPGALVGGVAAAGHRAGGLRALAGALLAYPLYVQFAGPMAYHGLSDAVRDYGNDIAAFFAPGSPTLGGNQRANVNLAPNYSEENAFFGWSLSLIAVGIVVWLRRDLIVRALAVTGAVLRRALARRADLLVGPGALHRPVGAAGAAAAAGRGGADPVRPDHQRGDRRSLLALAVERAWALRRPDRRTVRALTAAGLVLALLPIAPMPLRMVSRPPVPDFITADRWREYVAADQTLVPIPVPSMGNTARHALGGRDQPRLQDPRRLLPRPAQRQHRRPGSVRRPAQRGRRDAGGGGRPPAGAPKLDDRQRRRCLDELRHWQAAILVLPRRPAERRAAAAYRRAACRPRPAGAGRLGLGRPGADRAGQV